MRMKGKSLSNQARAKLNSALLAFLQGDKESIDNCCLIAELFGKERWRDENLRRLRARMRGLLVGLRVADKDVPSGCTILSLEDVKEQYGGSGGVWERLSTTLAAAFCGVDHSMEVKRRKKERAEPI